MTMSTSPAAGPKSMGCPARVVVVEAGAVVVVLD
jgi:hypothetical protein